MMTAPSRVFTNNFRIPPRCLDPLSFQHFFPSFDGLIDRSSLSLAGEDFSFSKRPRQLRVTDSPRKRTFGYNFLQKTNVLKTNVHTTDYFRKYFLFVIPGTVMRKNYNIYGQYQIIRILRTDDACNVASMNEAHTS